jgi:hypothetical protein
MVISFSLVSGCDHRGLMARRPKPPKSGAKRAQRPGKLKIGGDLQGEPIFCLSRPGGGFSVPIKGPVGAGSKKGIALD